jgi:hypothetical protein
MVINSEYRCHNAYNAGKIKVLKLVDFYEKMEEKKLRRQSASISSPVEDINVPVGRKQAALNNILENIQPVKQTLDGRAR